MDAPKIVNKNWQLRVEAMMHFMNHPDLKVLDLKLDPRWQHLSDQTLYNWAKQDKWREKREEQQAKWVEMAKQRLGSEILRAKRTELEELNSLRALANEKLTDPEVMPKSWEGVAKARITLSERLAKLQQEVQAEVVTQKKDVLGQVDLDEEEQRQVMEFILELRRQRHAAIGAPDGHEQEEQQVDYDLMEMAAQDLEE